MDKKTYPIHRTTAKVKKNIGLTKRPEKLNFKIPRLLCRHHFMKG
jgi:hypothetical protein